MPVARSIRILLATLVVTCVAAAPIPATLPAEVTPRIARLITILREGHEDDRAAACTVLREIGPPAKAAVPDLLAALRDRSSTFSRSTAASALLQIAPNDPHVIAAIIEAMNDPSHEVREEIADSIGYATPPIKQAIPALIRLLKDEEKMVRYTTAWSLGRIGPDAAPAVPALIEALNDPDLRSIAVGALGDIGPDARSAVPALVALLKSPQPFKQYIAMALAQIGNLGAEATSALVTATKDPDIVTRLSAMFALGRTNYDFSRLAAFLPPLKESDRSMRIVFSLGQNGAAEPSCEKSILGLLDASVDPDPRVRAFAYSVSGDVCKYNPAALVAALGSPDHNRRGKAALRLWMLSRHPSVKINTLKPTIIAALVNLLNDPEPDVRGPAGVALVDFHPAVIPSAVLKELHDAKWDARGNVVLVLGAIRGDEQTTRTVIAQLMPALKDDNRMVRYYAAFSLQKFGPEARDAVPPLIQALSDNDTRDVPIPLPPRPLTEEEKATVEMLRSIRPKMRVADKAAEVLGDIGPDARSAVPALIEQLKIGNADQAKVIQALGKIGTDAAPAVREIAARLHDDRLAIYAGPALARIPGAGTEALLQAHRDKTAKYQYQNDTELAKSGRAATPTLVAALSDKDPEFTRYVIGILGQMGPRADGAIPALAKIAADIHSKNSTPAIDSLGKIGPAAIPALTDLLGNSLPATQTGAMDALNYIGAPARAAIPALARALQDPDADVSYHAGATIKAIEQAVRNDHE